MSPRERKLEDRSKFWIGMIAVGVVAAIIASMLLYRQIGFGYTRYQAEFAQAAQLKKGRGEAGRRDAGGDQDHHTAGLSVHRVAAAWRRHHP
ncbi:Putative Mce family protein [Mycobacteroides abscessus subsp. abscessus]|nr:Putative Mce family protein [Mycobacteroides abscessus subsp. abscessus]